MAQIEQIRNILTRKPFQPFRLKMVDGTTHVVKHPDWLMIPPVPRPRVVTYFLVPASSQGDEYEIHWLDLALISEVIEPAAQPVSPKSDQGNGG
jgi:hypothetical protein